MATYNQKFAQLQPFALYGAGASLGATTITLQSMTDIDGNALTMSGDFGSKGWGTLEPGNGTLEEQISFSGLTNNTNGTVTLTGIKSVGFVFPYTETSGLAKTHAGSAPFVISNTAGFYAALASTADDETITGTWTFTNPSYPRMDTATPLPTDQEQLATKAYVDSVALAGAPNATTTVKGVVEIATQAEVDAKTAIGGTGASLTATPALARSTLLSDYVVDTGSSTAYAIAPSPAVAAYTAGQQFTFKAANTNTTTSPTLNVNALGAKNLKKLDGATALAVGDMVAGQIIQVEYDGTNFQFLSPAGQIATNVSNYQAFTANGTWTKPTGLTGSEQVFVQLWGGGAGGGSATSTANTSGAGGGGGGSYTEAYFRASDLGATVSVTIAAAVAAGVNGNNSTFGSLLTAYGGGSGLTAGNAQSTGGGGGGGTASVGAQSALSNAGGAGGDIGGGAAGTVGASSAFGGGGGGNSQGGGQSGYGGGGGGGNSSNGAGGKSLYGGGGGGSGSGAGGSSLVYGGNGGAGTSANGGTATAGTAPGGGGGGCVLGSPSQSATGGAGARGECRVWVMRLVTSTSA